jgi:DnaD/phage-associated family protein
MDIMSKYNMSCEMIVYAYEYVKESTKSSKPLKYMEKVLRSWYDASLLTPSEVKNSLAVISGKYRIYSDIFKELGFHRQPSAIEKETIDSWIDKYGMSMEMINAACAKSINVSNPSIAYVNGVIKSWSEENIKTLDELRVHEEAHKQKIEAKVASHNATKTSNSNNTNPKKTKFHNFKESYKTKYSPEELNNMARANRVKKTDK